MPLSPGFLDPPLNCDRPVRVRDLQRREKRLFAAFALNLRVFVTSTEPFPTVAVDIATVRAFYADVVKGALVHAIYSVSATYAARSTRPV